MTKAKRRDKKRKEQESPPDQRQPTVAQPQAERPRKFTWIPLWGWVLIFLVPLLISEYMFYVVGRTASMIIFPVAWIGFWIALMQRSGWPILKKRKDG
ncbi:MAG: hypothetical protein NUW24_02075 [Anaerolineae bacterium]|jgi:magnesium-transporting ATPase (P-type)|nr:hypothetical protein [Anaerolineae bacterium]MDH7472653.1 hypothetical protein [Anaerolineae bacterium]